MSKRKLGSISYSIIKFSRTTALPEPFERSVKTTIYPTIKSSRSNGSKACA